MIFIANVALVAALKNYGVHHSTAKLNKDGKVVFIYEQDKKIFKLQKKFGDGKLKINDAKWYSLELSKIRTIVRGVIARGYESPITANPTNTQVIITMDRTKEPDIIKTGFWNPFKDLKIK